MKTAVSHSSNH